MKKILLVLILSFGLTGLFAQRAQVSGTVTSAEDGQPLFGVSILVKGSNSGTTTTIDGKYSLEVPINATLVFSFLGTTPQEIAIGNRTVIDVVLEENALHMDEVVVTAMGISRQKNSIGYAAQEVKGDKLTITPQGDLNNAIVGKISGVRFWGASGATFDAGKIVLRGTSSLTKVEGDEPIYVVDGVITNVNVINMDNVESVNVLKGAAATALYGSRGGNGAVIISSKRGTSKAGKSAVVEFKQSIAVEKVVAYTDFQNEYGGGTLGVGGGELDVFEYDPAVHPSYLSVLNGARYYDMENDLSWGPRFDGQPYAPWYAWDPDHPKFGQLANWEGQPADNLKDLYKTGVTSNTNLSFSKSVGDFNTRISFANQSRTGVTDNSEAIRRFISVNANYKITDRLSISGDYKYTYRNNHNAAAEDYSGTRVFQSSYTQWFHRNVDIKELKNYKRPDGTFYTWNPTDAPNGNFEPMFHNNPFALMNEIDTQDRLQWNVLNSVLKFDIIKNVLNIGVNFNANIRSEFSETKVPYNISGSTSSYSVNQNQLFDTQMQAFAQFNKKFVSNRLSVDTHLYVEQRDYDYRSLSGSTTDGLTADKYYNLAASVGKPNASNSVTQLQERSVFGTGVVGWDDTYYIDFSLRNDWSSTLPDATNSYLYGGLSLAVITSKFLKNVEWLDFWKIRGSLAQVGSTMDAYQTQQVYVNQDKYNGMTSIRGSKNLLNPSIRPTISTSYEVGTEFRLFGNRLSGDFNYYIKDSKDQIINLTTVPASGFTSTKINSGLIRNEGIEISLEGTPVKTRDFQWGIYTNISKNTNKLVELDPNDPEKTQYRLYGMSFYNYLYSYAEVGKPIGVIRGSTYDRSPDGKIVYRQLAANHWAGDYLPLLNQTADAELGNVQPDFTGGFGTNFSYKGFRLDVSFDFQIGGEVGSVTNMFGEGSGLLNSTVGNNDKGNPIRDAVADGGGVKVEGALRTGTGDAATYEDVSGYLDAYYWYAYKSQIWEPNMYDAGYLKMREVSLSYQLPQKFVKNLNIGLSNATLALNVQNPWLIYSGVPNIDASAINNAYGKFLEMGQLYNTRIWGFTLNLVF
jgi:TonB-linked SusC/RagA family outer membrane protein